MKRLVQALFALWLAGCVAPRGTELVVRIDSDIPYPTELKTFRVEIRRIEADGGLATVAIDDRRVDLQTHELPFEIGVLAADPNDGRRVQIKVTANPDTGSAFTVDAAVSFRAGVALRVDMFLANQCTLASVRAVCERMQPPQSCGPGGRCVPIDRAELPTATQTGWSDDAAVIPEATPRVADAEAPEADVWPMDVRDAEAAVDRSEAGLDVTDGAGEAGEVGDADAVDAGVEVSVAEAGDALDASDARDVAAAMDGPDAPDAADVVDVVDVVEAEAPDVCVPQCTGRTCGGNQCGGTCGQGCSSGQVCNTLLGTCFTCTESRGCVPSGGACRVGSERCSSGAAVCLDVGPVTRGTPCGTGQACDGAGNCAACGSNGQACCAGACSAGNVCNATTGLCFTCIEGAACTPASGLCRAGAQRCASGARVCEETGPVTRGTACGSGQACDGSGNCAACGGVGQPCCSGSCSAGSVCNATTKTCFACSEGAACTPSGGICRAGLQQCGTGTRVCADAGPVSRGTTCGTNLACDGAGACTSCGGASQACCGTTCTAGQVCNTTTTTCFQCTQGAACTPTNACQTGTQQCGSGARVCQAFGNAARSTQPTGCAGTQACDGSGTCALCGAAGQPCCGSTCGAGVACNTATGSCFTCAQGAACTPSNVCRSGTQQCGSGALLCQESGNVASGTQPTGCATTQACDGNGTCATCGAPGQPCCGTTCATGAGCNLTTGQCFTCAQGSSCTSSNVCQTATLDCSTGAPVCQGSGNVARAQQPSGCAGSQACDGSGACAACGAVGQPCCGPVCGTGLECRSGTCQDLCPGMVYVPAGRVIMGAAIDDTSAATDERPIHAVSVSAFCMDRTEVTVAAYRSCPSGTCSLPGTDVSCNWWASGGAREQHPMNCVDWSQADAYCRWRGGARLPTEAEWEYAARGSDRRLYPWGNAAPSCMLANAANCATTTAPVGSYAPGRSPFGLDDMAGNVMEWLGDWYDAAYYGNAASGGPDPVGPSSGAYRILRGGAFSTPATGARATSRAFNDPIAQSVSRGFRCAKGLGCGLPGEPCCGSTCGEGAACRSGTCQALCPTGMVYIPGGAFQMGAAASDTSAASDERPVHTVTLSPFCIDQTEVTVAAYRACPSGTCTAPGAGSGCYWTSAMGGNEQLPVNCLDWMQSVAFCLWRANARLPIEAEWEYAARGTDQRIYPWGDSTPSCAIHGASGFQAYCNISNVGLHPAGRSRFGVDNMGGNVSEWVADWYDPAYYTNSQAAGSNPLGPSAGTERVIRGGALYYGSVFATAARRSHAVPATRRGAAESIGFRCARGVP